MIKREKILGIGAVVAGVAVFAGCTIGVMRTSAAEPTPAKLRSVAANCSFIKTRLENVEKTDVAARIKRGRTYDQELIPYISAFNSRIAASRVDAPELIRIAADLQTAVGPAQFGQLYTSYADNLKSAIGSDCESNPAETHKLIEDARVDRIAVAEQVQEIDRLTGLYLEELAKLEGRFTPAINRPSDLLPRQEGP